MLNRQELEILAGGALSLQARLVYALYLVNFCDNGVIVPDCVTIAGLLTVADGSTGRIVFRPNAGEIAGYLAELAASGLIAPEEGSASSPDGAPPAGARLILRYRRVSAASPASFRMFRMTPGWRPGPGFAEQAELAGLRDRSYTLAELNDFAAYWITRDAARDEAHWNLSFISFLKRRRREG